MRYGGTHRPPSPLIISETSFLNYTKELSYLFKGDPSGTENSPSGFPKWLGCLMSLLRLNRKKKNQIMDKRSQDQFRSMSRVGRTSPHGHSVLAAGVNLIQRLSGGEFLE